MRSATLFLPSGSRIVLFWLPAETLSQNDHVYDFGGNPNYLSWCWMSVAGVWEWLYTSLHCGRWRRMRRVTKIWLFKARGKSKTDESSIWQKNAFGADVVIYYVLPYWWRLCLLRRIILLCLFPWWERQQYVIWEISLWLHGRTIIISIKSINL